MGDRIEPTVGTSVCPLRPALLVGGGPLIASVDVLFWRGLCCSREAQDGEEAVEEEEERGSSGGEAGVLLGFSFSIMVLKSPCQCEVLLLSAALRVCVCLGVFICV